ncbi:hypothetical protein [Alteromonas sp. a30]|uniref:hypothetical protein n=1 Tax=Alteromonas sp. a30 TaxID=2730917 RepID=UPI00227E0254|nr:hypothetical protein [Alteromonas sp. a30]MCY7297240.1 hypothetical protein [Alteromonas sp. a30]
MYIRSLDELTEKMYKLEPRLKSLGFSDSLTTTNLDNYPELFNFAQDDEKITRILSLLFSLREGGKINESGIKTYLKSLLSHKTHYGFLCELLTLSYLHRNHVDFDVEVEVSPHDNLSKNTISLDGKTKSGVFFDIKGFGLQEYAKAQFSRLVEKEFPGHSVLINGKYDVSYNDIEKYAFPNTQRVISELKTSNRSQIEELYWDIRISNERIRSSVGESSPYAEAENNKNFIFRKCSQFTTRDPFILICTFDNQFNTSLSINFSSHTDIMTRALSRRAFMEFKNSDEYATCLDKKCKSDIKLSTASKYLSGILFYDIHNEKSWFYLNPNAEHKIDRHKINCIFNFENPENMYTDDFSNDNY